MAFEREFITNSGMVKFSFCDGYVQFNPGNNMEITDEDYSDSVFLYDILFAAIEEGILAPDDCVESAAKRLKEEAED